MSGKEITYSQALNDGLRAALSMSEDVAVFGQLVDYPAGVFGLTSGLVKDFGPERIQDMPVAESLMTSMALGAAAEGMRPVIVHQRLDFMLYAMDAIVNWISLWRFKTNGKGSVPLVMQAVIGKGWGQGPQHSKSLHNWFAHLPGLKVAMPATPFDAKGLLLESIFGEDPCILIEGRQLFSLTQQVPEKAYRVQYGKGALRKEGTDVTLVAVGSLMPIGMRAGQELEKQGISVEVIDPRTISPLDVDMILTSVRKTGRLVVADPGWYTSGFAGEVIALATEREFSSLKAAPVRVTLPDSHTPMSAPLEKLFYPDEKRITDTITQVVRA